MPPLHDTTQPVDESATLKQSLSNLEPWLIRFSLLAISIFILENFRSQGNGLWIFFMLLNPVLVVIALRRADPRRFAWLIPASVFGFVGGLTLTNQLGFTPALLQVTDGALFTNYGAHLILQGENPYTWNAIDAFTAFRTSFEFITPTIDGGVVANGYAALHYLMAVPVVWLGIENLGLFYALTTIMMLVILYRQAPKELRPIILLPMLLSKELLYNAYGWITDAPWALLILLMAVNWKRPTWRAVLFGLALSYKPTPALLLPFLMTAILVDEGDPDTAPPLQRTIKFAAISGVVFLGVNLPFMLADFGAWYSVVLEPVASALIYRGWGVMLLTDFSLLNLSKEFYLIMTGVVAIYLWITYTAGYRMLKHVIWWAPPVMMWFSYRNLPTYWTYWMPLALYGFISLYREHVEQPIVIERGDSHKQPAILRSLNDLLLTIVGWGQQRAMTIISVGFVVTAGLFVSVGLWNIQRTSDLEVALVHLPVSNSIEDIQQLVVFVENTSPNPIRPRFALQTFYNQPYAWQIDSGPDELAPGAGGEYHISTPLNHRQLNLLKTTQLVVTDGNGDYQSRGNLFLPVHGNYADPAMLFNDAYYTDGATTEPPFGWQLAHDGPVTLDVSMLDDGSRIAVIELETTPVVDEWQVATLGQEIPFPVGTLTIDVHPEEHRDDSEPILYGLALDDGVNQTWVTFVPDMDLDGEVTALSANHHIVTRFAPAGTWSTQTINPDQLYRDLGYALPPHEIFIRHGFQLMTPVLEVSLLVGVPPDSNVDIVMGQFGPLQVVEPPGRIEVHIARTIENRADYYRILNEWAELYGARRP